MSQKKNNNKEWTIFNHMKHSWKKFNIDVMISGRSKKNDAQNNRSVGLIALDHF